MSRPERCKEYLSGFWTEPLSKDLEIAEVWAHTVGAVLCQEKRLSGGMSPRVDIGFKNIQRLQCPKAIHTAKLKGALMGVGVRNFERIRGMP